MNDPSSQREGDDLSRFVVTFRDRLVRMVRLRLDPRLRGRIDASDVVQEALAEAVQRFDDFLSQNKLPLYLWLRLLVGQRLSLTHRRHLGTRQRDAAREVSLFAAPPAASSDCLARLIIGECETPEEDASRAEQRALVQRALDSMEATDREVLVLRHFEQLSNAETAQALGLSESGASSRYTRSLLRFRKIVRQSDASTHRPAP
jgi:RNA polymerase sigma-70 factor (ECF subfamily)